MSGSKCLSCLELTTIEGQGTYGTVWCARDKQTDNIVVIKVFPKLLGEGRALEECWQECKFLTCFLLEKHIIHAHAVFASNPQAGYLEPLA